ncbi:hypothetical protein [Streptomyces rimosus]|uniref:hypothetical protein n=1 Tax=Streptomyces rimosus TaxID=1927 RepID=UPI001F1FB59A|nr:hypothetical protein [Streptomyces rimosus]
MTTSIITRASLPSVPNGPQFGAIPPMMVVMSPFSAAKYMYELTAPDAWLRNPRHTVRAGLYLR